MRAVATKGKWAQGIRPRNFCWILTDQLAVATDTPAQILAKLVTVDGTGSGLDADLLDGHDSVYFATQAGLDTTPFPGGRLCYRFEEPVHRFQNIVADHMVGAPRVPPGDPVEALPMFPDAAAPRDD